MRSRAIVIAVVAGVLASTSVDLGACGDKYTRVGQSTRIKRYAAVHPASILVYKPAKVSAGGVNFYKGLLTGAGHKAEFVNYGKPIDQKITAGKIDVILVHYADLPALMSQLQSLTAKPEVVPILGKESMALATQAEKDYPFLIVPERMSPLDALDQIDHAMERRLKGAAGAGLTKGH
jgi:hypothetical protein